MCTFCGYMLDWIFEMAFFTPFLFNWLRVLALFHLANLLEVYRERIKKLLWFVVLFADLQECADYLQFILLSICKSKLLPARFSIQNKSFATVYLDLDYNFYFSTKFNNFVYSTSLFSPPSFYPKLLHTKYNNSYCLKQYPEEPMDKKKSVGF